MIEYWRCPRCGHPVDVDHDRRFAPICIHCKGPCVRHWRIVFDRHGRQIQPMPRIPPK